MPELPEVETIRSGLERLAGGRTVHEVDARPARLRGPPSPRPLADLEGRRLDTFHRHGKFLLAHLDDGGTWVVHLGMTGKLLFAAEEEPERPHTHLVLHLSDRRQLRFSDPRRFGRLALHPPGPVPETRHYGIDALDPGLTPAFLGDLLARSRAPLKAFLLDQTKVAGIGNIYACEALWRAGLSPRRRAQYTPRAKVPALQEAIVAVLEDSLAAGGSSFNDYVDAIGRPGSFLFDVAVFQRGGRACPRCGAGIRRIVQAGRSTFYCGRCQR